MFYREIGNTMFEQAQYESDLRLIELTGKNVVYQHGLYSIPVRAIPSKNKFTETTVDGAMTTFESDDFILDSGNLLIEGEPTTGQLIPERGDRILIMVRHILLTYEVQHPAGMMCYSYSAPDRRIIRIHTRLIDE
jgi:hypothetical protein